MKIEENHEENKVPTNPKTESGILKMVIFYK